jgi:Zn-dependent protease/CBS domain-containing protein
MSWSFRIAKIAGTEVRIHLTFFLLLAWIAWVSYRQGGWPAAIDGLAFILLLFACVVLHEFGHALAARAFGIRTPDITLLPIGGVARIRMPDKPVQELVIALAGPLVNVVIAAGLMLYLRGSLTVDDTLGLTNHRVSLPARLLWVNVVLVIFNMIPAFPMDGGRVLRALLAMSMSYTRASQIAAAIGQGLAFVFGFLGLLFNPWLILIAVFVFLGASYEASAAQLHDLARGLTVSHGMITDFKTLMSGDRLGHAVDLLLQTSQHDFPVVDGEGIVRGILTREGMIEGLKTKGVDIPVDAVMRTNIPSVNVHTPFDQACITMNECRHRGCPALPVLDRAGKLVGLFTPENVGEMMMVHAAMGRSAGSARRS